MHRRDASTRCDAQDGDFVPNVGVLIQRQSASFTVADALTELPQAPGEVIDLTLPLSL